MPNITLGRFMTLEMLGMVAVIAVSWGTVTSKVAGLEERLIETKQQQVQDDNETKHETKELKEDVSIINRKVDVLSNNQEHFKRQINKLDDQLGSISKDNRAIIKLLEKQNESAK